MNIGEFVNFGTRNFGEWLVARDGDKTTLAANDFDNQRTVAVDAEELSGEDADEVYAEFCDNYANGDAYPANRDPNRFSIWCLDRDSKDSSLLYVMVDLTEGSDPLFMASGAASAVLESFDEVLPVWFGIA